MTFAWYANLKQLDIKPRVVAAPVSWGTASFEYLFQVPANGIGYSALNIGQPKIPQQVVTLSVFAAFCELYLKEPLELDDLRAGLCVVGAVCFRFRGRMA